MCLNFVYVEICEEWYYDKEVAPTMGNCIFNYHTNSIWNETNDQIRDIHSAMRSPCMCLNVVYACILV